MTRRESRFVTFLNKSSANLARQRVFARKQQSRACQRSAPTLSSTLMHCRPALSILLLCPLAASAQSSNLNLPEIDAARISYRQTGNLDMGSGSGQLQLSQLEVRSLLSRPIPLADDWLLVPFADFTLSNFDLGHPASPTGFPFHNEDLYSLGVSAFAVHINDTSPWIYGGWARAELATDFEHVTSDALTFDLAAAGAYRFNDHFTLGCGAAVFNLNGHVSGYPVVGFDWIVSDTVRIGLYGPSFVAAYTPSQDWKLSLLGKTIGGIWNVTDTAGNSRAMELTTYQIGVSAERRLSGKLWLSATVGASVGNQLEYTTLTGSTLYRRAPEAGAFAQIGLRLKAW